MAVSICMVFISMISIQSLIQSFIDSLISLVRVDIVLAVDGSVEETEEHSSAYERSPYICQKQTQQQWKKGVLRDIDL